MITLFLDTSTTKFIVGIYKNFDCLFLDVDNNNNDLSSKVLPTIDNAIKKCDLLLDDIDKIIVVNGPGSFTGIRVGVTIAKTLAWTKNIDILTISSLELLATTKSSKEYVVPLIDARRDYFYAGVYLNGKNIINDQYISRSELLEKIKKITDIDNVYFVSYDNIDNLDTHSPELVIEKIIKKYSNKKSLNPHSVNPNYLKRVEAEEKLDDKRNK